MLKPNQGGYFPYRPATNLLYGLREAIARMREEGLPAVFARHERMAKATRAAVQGWAREVLCEAPSEDSPVLTAVVMPGGHDADAFRQFALDRFNISLGAGLSKLSGQVFRIGHLGECNDLMLMGALSGAEMAPGAAGVPHQRGGATAAMSVLKSFVEKTLSLTVVRRERPCCLLRRRCIQKRPRRFRPGPAGHVASIPAVRHARVVSPGRIFNMRAPSSV